MLLKKALTTAEKRVLVDTLKNEYQLSERRSCKALDIARSAYQYRPDPHRDDAVIDALKIMAERYPRYGFR